MVRFLFVSFCAGLLLLLTSVSGAVPCDSGCLLNEVCVPYGTRSAGTFCALTNTFEVQVTQGALCDNDFQCTSNVCSSGTCVDVQGAIRETQGFTTLTSRLICRIANPFSDIGYQTCLGVARGEQGNGEAVTGACHAYQLRGDANDDGRLNETDIPLLASAQGRVGDICCFDVNADEVVDARDLRVFEEVLAGTFVAGVCPARVITAVPSRSVNTGIRFVPLAGTPGAPTLTGYPLPGGAVLVITNLSVNVENVTLYRAVGEQGAFRVLATWSDERTVYTDRGLFAGVTYRYQAGVGTRVGETRTAVVSVTIPARDVVPTVTPPSRFVVPGPRVQPSDEGVVVSW